MTFRTLSHAVLLAALAVSTTSCAAFKKKKKTGGLGNDADFVQGTPIDGAAGLGGAGGLGTPLPDRAEGTSFLSSNIDRRRFSPVHFGFDSYEVSAGEQSKVSAVVSALKGSSESVIVAGFTDERGTAEYNRGLGERRAQAVRQAMMGQGLPNSRIQTVSFGAEMPVDSGSSESAWAKNRRAEFGVAK
jgi:peptidoglycan-associated lipoprotein